MKKYEKREAFVCEMFGVERSKLWGDKRASEITQARHFFYFLSFYDDRQSDCVDWLLKNRGFKVYQQTVSWYQRHVQNRNIHELILKKYKEECGGIYM